MATSTLGSGTLVLAGTTSGTTTVTATAVAGTTTLTLPAATDTLVGRATTDTLTNKTLTGAAMNGTLGATTASTVAATTLTTSSTVTHNGGTANGVAYLNGSKVLTSGSALTFDGTTLTAPQMTLTSSNGLTMNSASGGLIDSSGNTLFIQFPAANSLIFRQSGSPYAEYMRLTSTGLGIGTSSPAQTLHVKTSTSATPITLGVLSNATGLPALSFNGAYASTTMAGIYANGGTSTSLYYEVPSGNSHFFGIADVTKMTLDASGNLGIGTSSPTAKLTVSGNQSFPEKTAAYIGVDIATSSGNGGNFTVKAGNGSGAGNTAGNLYLGAGRGAASASNGAIYFGTAQGTNAVGLDSTLMTLDASGNLLVGTSILSNRLSVVAPSGQYVARFGLNGTGAQSFVNFVIGEDTTPTGVGSVTYNGSLTLYNQTSDQRLKENIVDAGTALATLNQIKVRAFDWIVSKTHETHGVVAQELKEVAPQCVTEGINHEDGSIDRPWQVDTSPLVPMLIKAIQELTARITALEGA